MRCGFQEKKLNKDFEGENKEREDSKLTGMTNDLKKET
jgi:hypothetical protein